MVEADSNDQMENIFISTQEAAGNGGLRLEREAWILSKEKEKSLPLIQAAYQRPAQNQTQRERDPRRKREPGSDEHRCSPAPDMSTWYT